LPGICTNCAYLYNQGVWIFGDWEKALRAARFDPERMRMRTFWDNKKITQELCRMRKEKLRLYPYYVMKNHPALFSGALCQFGLLHKALMAAGLTKKKRAFRKNRGGLLGDLRDVMESRSNIPQSLSSEIDYYFGSLRKVKLPLRRRSGQEQAALK
jgi:hypothetical protein